MRTLKLAPLALLLITATPANANIDIVFDYSHNTSAFFTNNALSKSLLDAAASVFETRITDTLGAIDSSGRNDFELIFQNPSNASLVNIPNSDIGINEIRIYIGAENLGTSTLGQGGPGGYSASGSPAFLTSINRGQTNVTGVLATDFSPGGGSISFNSAFSSWFFDASLATSTDIAGYDFYSVALHEISHVLGFGTAESWNDHVVGICSQEPCSLNGKPLAPGDKAHWAQGATSTINGLGSFEVAMDPALLNNKRKELTDQDWAGLSTIGWQVAAVPEPETWAMLLAGLGLVGFAAGRKEKRRQS